MKHPEHIPASVTIQCIQDPDQKQRIARDVLEALPDWFGVPESREAYIRGSRDQTMFAANCGGAFSGFLCLKRTGNATVELAALALGVEGARIAKTLSFKTADGCMLILAAGDARIDNHKFLPDLYPFPERPRIPDRPDPAPAQLPGQIPA